MVDDTWKAPIHPHIYSNGHICASILGNDWSPGKPYLRYLCCRNSRRPLLSAECRFNLHHHAIYAGIEQVESQVSRLLSGSGRRLLWLTMYDRPEGDQRYVRNAPANPKLTSWRYDDDVCTK